MKAKGQSLAVFAGFWRRAAAFFIDSVILAIVNTLVNLALGDHTTAALLLNIALNGGYFAGFHSSAKQATPGKMVFGIRVTDLEGNRISVQRAIGRFFATWLSALIFMIGYLMAAFTDRKRALHDIVCKTLVVNRDAEPSQVVEGVDTMPITFGVVVIGIIWIIVPAVGIVAAVAIPMYQDRLTRAAITDAVGKVEPLKKEVADAMASRRPIPAGKRSIDSPFVDSVVIGPTGQVTLHLSKERTSGGQVFFAPLASRGGPVEWKCWSEGISESLITAACR